MADAANKRKAPRYRIAISRSQAKRLALKQGKSITDAPDLRAAEWRCCDGCKFFKVVDQDWGEEAADGLCTQYDFGAEGDWVCDSWEKQAPAQMEPIPVTIVDDGTALPVTVVEGPKAVSGNVLKALRKTDDQLVVGNYLVLFGGRDLSGIGAVDATGRQLGLTGRNGDGSIGEFFTKATDFSSPYVDADVIAVDWEHGFEPESDANLRGPGKDDVLGRVDWKSARIDDKGLFVERVLNRRNAYVQWIEALVEAGLVGTSSKCVDGQRAVKATGEITRWALERDTLTVTPYEPRMLSSNTLAAIKALRLEARAVPTPGAHTPEAPQGAAGAAGAPTGLEATGTSTADKEHLMPNELEAMTKSLDVVGESVKGIATSVAGLAGRLESVEKALKAEKPAGSGVQVTQDEADRPYKSLGEQLQAVRHAALHPYEVDKRLLAINAKAVKATGASEGSGSDGGYLVQSDFATELFRPAFAASVFASRCRSIPMSDPSNRMTMNAVAETSRATGSRAGGLQTYWLGEGGTLTASRPKFRLLEWNLRKLTGLFYATDEQIRDTRALTGFIKDEFRNEFAWMLDDAAINGGGANKPLGFLSSGAVISIAKETGQAAATVVFENVVKMRARMPYSSRANMVWLINQDVEPSLQQMVKIVGTGGVPVYLPAAGVSAAPYDTLFGRPVLPVEQAQTLGTVGDIMAVDPQQYMLVTKDNVQEAESIHVQFVTDETTFRFILRVDGQPLWNSAVTPANGSNTLSPYISLATRA